MPNHVIHELELKCSPERFKEFAAKVKTEQEILDFDALVPQPQHVIDSTDERNQGDNLPSWYGWRVANWGTKWNAYSVALDEQSQTYSFKTAWSTPFPVLEAAARMFPQITFYVKYADEDIGTNCGTLIITHEGLEEIPPSNPEEFAADLWGIENWGEESQWD